MNSNFLYLGLLSPSVVDGLGNRRWYWSIRIFVFMCSNTRTILILLGSNGLCVYSIFYCRAAFADDVEWYMAKGKLWPKPSNYEISNRKEKCIGEGELNDGVSVAVWRMGGSLPGYGHVVSKTKGKLGSYRSPGPARCELSAQRSGSRVISDSTKRISNSRDRNM